METRILPSTCDWMLIPTHMHAWGDTKDILIYILDGGYWFNLTAEHVSKSLNLVGSALCRPPKKGIPFQHISMHLLRRGKVNALALAGYSDTLIQKMGQSGGDI